MSDRTAESAPSAADADVAVARLTAMSPDLRGLVVLGPGGEPLAASGELERWGEAGRALLDAADAAAGERASHAHVGTEDGEAFAVREGDYAIVAATDRFALASLVVFDIRAVLRDLVRGPGPELAARNGAG